MGTSDRLTHTPRSKNVVIVLKRWSITSLGAFSPIDENLLRAQVTATCLDDNGYLYTCTKDGRVRSHGLYLLVATPAPPLTHLGFQAVEHVYSRGRPGVSWSRCSGDPPDIASKGHLPDSDPITGGGPPGCGWIPVDRGRERHRSPVSTF